MNVALKTAINKINIIRFYAQSESEHINTIKMIDI